MESRRRVQAVTRPAPPPSRLKISNMSRHLPWRALVAPGVVRHDDGSLQCSFSLYGPDLSNQSKAVRGSHALAGNNMIRRLGSGWSIHAEDRRLQVRSDFYPESPFAHPLAQRIDRQRRARFLTPGRHYLPEYYVTLHQQMPSAQVARLEQMVMAGDSPIAQTSEADRVLRFRSQAYHLAGLLGGHQMLVPMSDAETVTYLHSTVSWKHHRVKVPDRPNYLHMQLTDCDLQEGFDLRLGPLWMYIVMITDLPDESVAGLLMRLDELPVEFSWCSRYIAHSKPKARHIMRQIESSYQGARQSIWDRGIAQIFGRGSAIEDSDALNKRDAVNLARQEIGADFTGFGNFTHVIKTWHPDAATAYRQAEMIEEVINDLECTAGILGLNAEEGFYGSLPGDVRHNLGALMESSLNWIHTMPGHMRVWTGPASNPHLKGPPLFYATTAGSTPIRISTHAGDVGNIMVLGPQGKGKTTILDLMILMWQKYVGGHVVALDVKGGMRCPTLCLGGMHLDLGTAGPSLQPLGDLDTRVGFEQARQWLLDRLEENHVDLKPSVLPYVANGLEALKQLSRRERTLTNLMHAWRDLGRVSERTAKSYEEKERRHTIQQAVRDVIEPFQGGLLDGDHDELRDAAIQCFEWETLLETPRLIAPTISYLWPRLEQGFTGQPTLFLCDEFNRLVTNDKVAERIDKGIRLYRYRNVAFVVATQFVEDVLDPRIEKIIQSFPILLLLPNPSAESEHTREAYERVLATEEEIKLVARAQEKRDFLYKTPENSRLCTNLLEDTDLTVCGHNAPADQRRMTALLQQYGLDNFWKAWLRDWGEDVDDEEVVWSRNGHGGHAPVGRNGAGTVSRPSGVRPDELCAEPRCRSSVADDHAELDHRPEDTPEFRGG